MISRILFVLLLAAALTPALAFAGRPLWVLAPAALGVGVCLGFAAVGRLAGRSGDWTTGGRLIAVAAGLWCAVAAFAYVQTLGLGPASVVGGAWAAAADLLTRDFDARISFNAGAAYFGILKLGLYGGVFLAAYWICRGRRRAWIVLWAVVAMTTVAALYALGAALLGIESVWGFEKRHYVGWATGPFENRNTFAGYLAVGLACASGLWMRDMRRDGATEGPSWRFWAFLSGRGLVMALPAVVLATAVAMTGSRAGLAAMALAPFLTVLFALAAADHGRRRLAAGAAILAALGLLAALAGDRLTSRSATLESSFAQRAELYGDTLRIIADRPLVGVGLGAFPEAIHAYKSTELSHDWKRAHNVYLEVAAELGLPAALAAFAAVGFAAFAAARGLWTRRYLPPMPAAAVGGFLAAAAHSLVDAPLQEPGIALTLALLLGTAAAQADGAHGA